MRDMRDWRRWLAIVPVVAILAGCTEDPKSDPGSGAPVGEAGVYQLHEEPSQFTEAGLSPADKACRQMAGHRYLKAADSINVATNQGTDQWRDLAQAVRTIAWSSWVGDVGPQMSRAVAVEVIRSACSKVRSQDDGAGFAWSP
jgi:hypothetical protein